VRGTAGAGDDGAQAARAGALGVGNISSGMRWAEITCASNGTPNCLRMATAFCITSQSEDEPMMTPTSGLFCRSS
jgi:hypothetical protein